MDQEPPPGQKSSNVDQSKVSAWIQGGTYI
jgi:hypothetical protein